MAQRGKEDGDFVAKVKVAPGWQAWSGGRRFAPPAQLLAPPSPDSTSHEATLPQLSADDLKRTAGVEAARSVHSGMRIGLGTGSTVAHFLVALARRIVAGELTDVVGVPTSVRTEEEARGLGLPVTGLEEAGALDLTVDGADEIDPGLELVKGLGGALLREKIVAQASRRMIVIAGEDKLVSRLGERAPLPVEVASFGFGWHLEWLRGLGAEPVVRAGRDGRPRRTDNGNVVIDCRFPGGIEDPAGLESRLAGRAGVVESGLFLGLADEAVVAGTTGVRRLRRGGEAS